MKHPQILLFAVCLCLLFFNLSCKNGNPITPLDDTPGRRDYTWFVDTIYAGGNYVNGIDGVSPNDVWVITNAGDFSQTFYHFDGTNWLNDGINRSIAPNAIRAFTSHDVWAVGIGGDIWHYNGTSWNQNTKIQPPNTNYYDLEGVDGNSSVDQYAVGNLSFNGDDLFPLIYHYNGSSWTRINIQNIVDCDFYKIRFYAQDHALILGSTHKPDGSTPDSSQIFMFDGEHLQEIYSALENREGLAYFTNIPNGIIILRGVQLTYFDGIHEQEIFTVQNSLFVNSIEARNVKDIFLGMSDGIAHYNGSDVQFLLKFNLNFRGFEIIKIFPNSVFIATHDWNTNLNIIYRGYLK